MSTISPTYSRAATVANWFDLPLASPRRPQGIGSFPLPTNGQIILIGGPSGSGKSTLLRRYRRRFGPANWIDLARIALPAKPVIELFPDWPLEDALHLLSRLGLAEAHIYLRQPRQLSTGQHWRLRLAVALYQAACRRSNQLLCLACDEFTAVLDRVTAAIVAHCLRRQIGTWPNLCAVVATAQDDLFKPLRPDRCLRCGFDQ